MEALRAAFQAAGAISANDCMKLASFSRDDPAAQVQAFKLAHPGLFYDSPPFNARTATRAECDAQLRTMQQAEAKRQLDATTARMMERLHAGRAAADARKAMQAEQLRERQAAEQQRLTTRHAQQRGGR